MSTLGARASRVLFTDRAGNRIGDLTSRQVSQGKWARVTSDVSDATSTFTAEPGTAMADLEPWLHHVTTYRGDDIVWRGVVYSTAVAGNQVTVTARDPAVYFDRRRIGQERRWVQEDLSTIAATVIRDAMAIDDPFNILGTMVVEPTGTYITRSVKLDERMVAEELKDLTEAGLVWTVHGGRVLIGPVAKAHTTAAISDQDVDARMTITKNGSATMTDARILGKNATGVFSDYASPIGVLQTIEKKDALTSEADCTDAARAIVKARSITPRRISLPGDSRLLATAPVDVNELIVGAQVPVRTRYTGVLVNQDMTIDEVSGVFGPGKDEISVTLVEPEPALTPDELAAPFTGY